MLNKQRFPWFTILFSILLIGIYAGMVWLSGSLEIDPNLFEYFGAPSAVLIYLGEPWGVISNSLVHVSLYHLGTNLVALWLLCGFLERRMGWLRISIFGLACAAFSSMVQLATTDDPGLGISGANFGFLALIAIQSIRDQRYRINPYVLAGFILVIGLILLLINAKISEWELGLESKIAAIVWALLVVSATRISKIGMRILVLMIPFCLLASTLLYAPWSSMWQSAQGIRYHEEEDYDKARIYYDRALEINPTNLIAAENLILIKIEELSDLAYDAHLNERYGEARKLYLQILALDSHNRWALTNIKKLP